MTPEGAIVRSEERVAVIADLHLGYERSRQGDFLPEVSLQSVQKRLGPLLAEAGVKQLVVAGDVVESAAGLQGRGSALDRFCDWLGALDVEPVLVAGNHDDASDSRFVNHHQLAGWLIHHGHENSALNEAEVSGRVMGHWHPAACWQGRRYRAFLTSPDKIILPAFSADAAGIDLFRGRSSQLEAWREYRCLICLDRSLLDFGKLRDVRERLRSL